MAENQVAAVSFSADVLRVDAEAVVAQIGETLREQVFRRLRRRGVVLGLSGGIDSSVTASLCVKALGANRVLGVLMPEEDSDPESLRLGHLVAESLGIEAVVEDIAPLLKMAGCYTRRDGFIRQVVPEYGAGYRAKMVLPNLLEAEGYNLSSLVVEAPDGIQTRTRLPLDVYLGIVAATNMKQRTRKQLEYYHADRLNYAVAGTPNRLEYDQGFFVKNGDGAADIKPIAHLYKTQVYQLAEALNIPEEIRQRPPTTDTYSLPQSQEEFFFVLPYPLLDLCLYGLNHGVAAEQVATTIGLTTEQVARVYRDLEGKRRATFYHHAPPLLIEPVKEVV